MTIYHHSWSFMAEPLATVLWYAWKNIGKMEHTLAGRTRSLRKDRVLYNYDFKNDCLPAMPLAVIRLEIPSRRST